MESVNDRDGEFWMDIKDFKKNFYHTTICHWQPDYTHLTVEDCHRETGHAVCRVTVKEDVNSAVYFCLNQMHKRFASTWPDNTHVYAPL